MELHRILTYALSAMLVTPAMAQDRNNEDGVVKVDGRYAAYNYRDGEVIVKFKSQSAVRMNASRGTMFRTSGVNTIDATLKELGVTEVEALMPLSGNQQTKGVTRSFSGSTLSAPAMNRLYLMHYDKTKVNNAEEAVAKLAKLADVEYAEPNRIVHVLGGFESAAAQSKSLSEVQGQTQTGG